MTLLIVSCLWLVAATMVALLPTRYQYGPGALLLLASPVLICLIGYNAGPSAGIAAGLVLLSVFRRPWLYYPRRVMGAAR